MDFCIIRYFKKTAATPGEFKIRGDRQSRSPQQSQPPSTATEWPWERRCPLWVSSFLLWSGSALPAHRLRDCAFTATPKMQRLWPRYDNSSWGHPLCQALSEALPRAVVWTSALEGRYHATSQTRDLQHREREQFARDHRGGKGHSHSANTPRCL